MCTIQVLITYLNICATVLMIREACYKVFPLVAYMFFLSGSVLPSVRLFIHFGSISLEWKVVESANLMEIFPITRVTESSIFGQNVSNRGQTSNVAATSSVSSTVTAY